MVHTASFLPNAGCLSNSCLAWRSGNCSLSTYRPRTQQYAEAVGQWTVSGCFVHPQREGLPGDEVTLSGTLSAGGHTHGGLCLVLCRFHGPPPVLDRSERCFDPLDFTGKDASGIKQKGTKGHTARTRQNLNPALPDAKPQPRSIFMWEWGGGCRGQRTASGVVPQASSVLAFERGTQWPGVVGGGWAETPRGPPVSASLALRL